MKKISFLVVILLSYACSTTVQQENQSNTVIDEKNECNIYLDGFKPSEFTYADFIKLQEITKEYPERLDTIPKDIAYRLTSKDTNDVDFFCMWIDAREVFPLGVFEIRGVDYATEFYVTFSKEGIPIDYLILKRADIEKSDGKVKWKYLSDVTFFFCEDCFPETIEYFLVKTLDTTEDAIHPHVAKALKTDNWCIDENGKFKLLEEE